MLLVSANTLDYHHTGILYYVGNFDGIRFEAEEKESNLRLDFGRDNYAAVTYGGIKERTVIQGWMSCWAYAEKVLERGFRGAMTIPRELGLKKTQAGWRMVQRPIRELYGAGVKDVSLAAEGVTALTGEPVLLRLKWKGESCCLRFGSENGPGKSCSALRPKNGESPWRGEAARRKGWGRITGPSVKWDFWKTAGSSCWKSCWMSPA